jgi:hypothetical protein
MSTGSLGVTIFGENIKVSDEHPSSNNLRYQSDVGVDDSGVVHVIWSEYAGLPAKHRVYYSQSTDGGLTFQPSIAASNLTKASPSTNLIFPRFAVGADGIPQVIWTNFEGGNSNPMVYHSRSIDNGSSFESPRMITQRNTSIAVEVDWKGFVHLLLIGVDGNLYHLMSEDGGESFGEGHRVNDVDGTALRASIVVDQSSVIHVAWLDARDFESLGPDIYYSKSTDGGQTFSKAIRVNDDDEYKFQRLPRVDVDSKGNPYIFWIDPRFFPDEGIMYSVSTDSGLSFSENKLFHLSNRSLWLEIWNFDIAVGSANLVRIAWTESFQTPRDRNIWYSELNPANGVASNRVLVTDDLKNHTYGGGVSIDMDSEDNTHVVWSDNRNTKGKGVEVFYAKSKEGEAEVVSYEWDMNNFLDSDSDGNFTNDVDTTGPTSTFVHGDDGVYTVTLKVTDEVGAIDYDTATVTVLNIDPAVLDVTYKMDKVNASISFRIAGEKWHNVQVYLYEDGAEIGYANITRYPGSPNDQMISLAEMSIDFSKSYSAVAYYTPEDDPINGEIWGASPAWFILEFDNGEKRIHHTFNVRHEDTWVWNIPSMNEYFPIAVSFEAVAFDPGSDDLKITWDFGDGASVSTLYYNDGVGPDSYPSPDINPITISDAKRHTFMGRGTYTVTLSIRDDDGGLVTHSFDLTF